MQHDLRTLAEQVLRRFQDASGRPEGWLQFLGESEAFARAYLAAHPADDGERRRRVVLNPNFPLRVELPFGQVIEIAIGEAWFTVRDEKTGETICRVSVYDLARGGPDRAALGVPLRAGEEG